MEYVRINREKECLSLEGFQELDGPVTIKVFGSDPSRLVIIAGHSAAASGWIKTIVKDNQITDKAAYDLFAGHTAQQEVPFVYLDDGYYEVAEPTKQ